MISLLASLTMARKALQAQQAAIQTTGHNIANANTPGYTRQRVDMAPTIPFSLGQAGLLGTGVDIKEVTRLRDLLLDSQFRDAHQALGQQEAEEATLTQIQGLVGEPSDNGLANAMSALFASFQDLANNPTDLAVRTVVRDKARALADQFHRLDDGLESLKVDLNNEIQVDVKQVNGLAQQIADLNRQIAMSEGEGGMANDLRDQRDQALDDLSKLVSGSVVEETGGQVRVTVGGGLTLVDGQTSVPIVAQAFNAADPTYPDSLRLFLGGNLMTPGGGRLAGLLNSRNSATGFVKGFQSELDAMAKNLILEINRLHASGIGLQGLSTLTSENAVASPTTALNAAGLPFTPTDGTFKVFVYNSSGVVTASGTITVTAGTTTLTTLATAISGVGGLTATVGAGNKLTITAPAGGTFTLTADTSDTLVALGLHGLLSGNDAQTIAVSNSIQADARMIAAATPNLTSGLFDPGDNSNALALAQLPNNSIASLSNSTFSGYLSNLVSDLAEQEAGAKRSVNLGTTVADSLTSRRDQASGVSLDEEMTNLIRFQKAYEAAAHFTTVVNDLLGTLINQLGR
ncbi:flagellar hook-associated protein FlgK [Candidatus Methylomirabilis sp.]|uniref:flagellar hook-associated protein FlgK n=1 Tax=Candidatus Methylomirabilis sp. TaxID=2032687 RepID=UPI002A5FA588|nr:flagellar hook-associated protein FlgK [Candidatus Methylomirabilis sp.]